MVWYRYEITQKYIFKAYKTYKAWGNLLWWKFKAVGVMRDCYGNPKKKTNNNNNNNMVAKIQKQKTNYVLSYILKRQRAPFYLVF